MDKTIYRYIKVGLVYSQAYPDSFTIDENFTKNFQKISDAPYFNAIEFHSPKDRGIRKECIKILKDSRMYRTYIGPIEFTNAKANMLSWDKSERERASEVSCRLIDDALEWESEEIMFFNALRVVISTHAA